jgi:hypothetical protein
LRGAAITCPVGLGTLFLNPPAPAPDLAELPCCGVAPPRLFDEFIFGEPIFDELARLCAHPAGGRGTDLPWTEPLPADLLGIELFRPRALPEKVPFAPAELLDRAKFCGGRGTKRPPMEALPDASEPCPFEGRPAPELGCPAVIRGLIPERPFWVDADWFAPGRADPNELDLAAAGGVIRLVTGRDIARAGAPAAGRPAFGPNLLCIVGFALTRPSAGAFRIALAFTRTALPRTDNPCSSVPRETAVNPPRTFMLA